VLFAENLSLNPKLIVNVGDLKRLLPGFIELPEIETPSNLKTSKFVGAVKLFKSELSFLIKFVVRHGRAVRISIGSNTMFDLEVRRIGEQMLNSLTFLLTD
jgi:hypothetical protein